MGSPETSSRFWATQPVRLAEDVRADIPYSQGVPEGSRFCDCDPRDLPTLAEIHALLDEHYVEAEDSSVRLCYERSFVAWALTPPGASPRWNVGLRTGSGALIGFIAGFATILVLDGDRRECVVVSFLCVRGDLRDRGVAPLLIRELTSRVTDRGIHEALFTTGTDLPVAPFCTASYRARLLQPAALVEAGFTHRFLFENAAEFEARHALRPWPRVARRRPLQPADLPGVGLLLRRSLARARAHYGLDDREIEHWLAPDNAAPVYAYVVEDERGNLTDLYSFYRATLALRHGGVWRRITVAYLFYWTSESVPAAEIFEAAASSARDRGCDVLYALVPTEAWGSESLRSWVVTGVQLRYHLFNRLAPTLSPHQVALPTL